MARVSATYNLGVTQGGLDFVDVDVEEDVPVFIDPSAIRAQAGDWIIRCQESLRSFFDELLQAIKAGNQQRTRQLMFPLVEPNETHLGMSRGRSRGMGLGNNVKAQRLINALAASKAVKSGFLQDLEDTALLVPGVDRDIVSDIATSVIRAQLIEYTQKMCAFYRIPMERQQSGPYWDLQAKQWDKGFVDLPRAGDNKLLLVPKSIVRVSLTVDKGKYYRGYLRPYFEELELDKPASDLVMILKDKRRKVRLGKLDEVLGVTKTSIVDNTQKFPQALDKYRKALDESLNSPLPDQILRGTTGTPPVDVVEMLNELKSIVPGHGGATLYHRVIAKLLTALFDTYLGNCRIEEDLHASLKRIDVVFDNVAAEGFFRWLGQHYSAATVVVECKNYGRDIGNPELDQTAMRLAPQRGQIGLLTVRSLEDKARALQRAKSVADDGHGYVIVLDDEDIEALVQEHIDYFASYADGPRPLALLRERFDRLLGRSGAGLATLPTRTTKQGCRTLV
ncbi:MAG: hypothetical protein ACJ74O_02765 [Frankiaceae bacterium]